MLRGWDRYAGAWHPRKFREVVLPGHPVTHVGDEWTAERSGERRTTYGLPPEIVTRFEAYVRERLLDPYLPASAEEGLEIGPGGGRLTALLLPRTGLLHAAEPARAMLAHLKRRFADAPNLRCYRTDGVTLPRLRPGSLDYVVAFDVFVHFEPRLIYWYLRQIAALLKPGGVGILHYATLLTPTGWQQFERDLELNLKQRTFFAAFGVMCPEMMGTFLERLGLQVVSVDLGLIPRDAVAVFRTPRRTA